LTLEELPARSKKEKKGEEQKKCDVCNGSGAKNIPVGKRLSVAAAGSGITAGPPPHVRFSL